MFKGVIRDLEEEDLKAIKAIFSLYWEGELRDRFVQRSRDFVDGSLPLIEQGYKYFIAEDSGEVIGVGVLRRAPEHMQQYAQTDRAAEFYVVAVKYKGRGVGTALREARIKEARRRGFKEALLYSAENHKDSWDFHDNSGFKRISKAMAPNGDPGYIWRMEL